MKKLQLATPIALAVVLGGVLSGCAAGQQPLTAGDIIQKMRDTAKTTTTVQGSVDLNLTINKDGLKTLMQGLSANMGGMMGGKGNPGDATGGNGSHMGGNLGNIDWSQVPDSVSVSLNYWKQSPDKVRVDVLDSSISQIKGSSLIYDGQKAYALDAPNKTVYTATPSKLADKIPANVKTMLSGVDFAKQIDTVISATNVTLLGTEEVAGIDAYKLDVTVKPDAATILGIPQQYAMPVGVLIKDLHATIYVDKDRFVPLKFTLEHPQMGSFTYSASKLDLNKTIDASTFVMQVPAGYKTVDLDQKIESSTPSQMTLPDARAAAQKDGWTLLEPSYVPTGSTLVGVSGMERATGGGFMLSYSSPTTDFAIMEGKTSMPNMLGDNFSGVNGTSTAAVKEVTVRGVQAKAFSPDGSKWTALIWQEKGTGIYVAIRGSFSVDEAVKIANSLQ